MKDELCIICGREPVKLMRLSSDVAIGDGTRAVLRQAGLWVSGEGTDLVIDGYGERCAEDIQRCYESRSFQQTQPEKMTAPEKVADVLWRCCGWENPLHF